MWATLCGYNNPHKLSLYLTYYPVVSAAGRYCDLSLRMTSGLVIRHTADRRPCWGMTPPGIRRMLPPDTQPSTQILRSVIMCEPPSSRRWHCCEKGVTCQKLFGFPDQEKYSVNIILSMSSLIFPLITFRMCRIIAGGRGSIRSVTFATSTIVPTSPHGRADGHSTYGIAYAPWCQDDKASDPDRAEVRRNAVCRCAGVCAALVATALVMPQFREDQTLILIIGTSFLT